MDEKLIPGLLVAMPNLQDPYFQKSVILLCEYTSESAFGVIINRPSSVMVKDIFVDEVPLNHSESIPVLVGGPVQPEFLWSIHSTDFKGSSTTPISRKMALSPLQDLLGALANTDPPQKFHFGCGYAGWGPGQLDSELREGAWWLTPLHESLVLELPYESRWEAALKAIGIDPQLTTFFSTGEA